jgi:hypothetical protein
VKAFILDWYERLAEPAMLILSGFFLGVAIGALIWGAKPTGGWLAELESECHSYMGDRAMLVYHEGKFYCLEPMPK